MSLIGQIEKRTQERVVGLFRDRLGYHYLGNWIDRPGNANIEPDLLRTWLLSRGVDPSLAERAIHGLQKAASDNSKSFYDRNKEVYGLLRYGVPVKPGAGESTVTVWLIDWEHPEANHFAVAEEVTVAAPHVKAHTKRPDVVLYVNGIALAVLELKRSTVAVTEGIRQNLDNQKPVFIQHFFSTIHWVMAGNDTEGLRYGTIETPEKHYLAWREEGPEENLLDRALVQLCAKERLLELVHDFVVFDAGIKKLCRHNQYFGVKAAQESVRRRQGGIIWHTQGSGKSLTMVWLARWIQEHVPDGRVLIITDREELDEQIHERVFQPVGEEIHRTRSGADLVATLNAPAPWLVCSLIHKFGGRDDEEARPDVGGFLEEVQRALPPGFRAKGQIFVFVDECHRTQSGLLHRAMRAILPEAVLIGFTGTPLLQADKQRSIEVFGPYIHTYRFDEAVRDQVVLDLRYEAREIPQQITSQTKIDQWFEAKTKGLTESARAELKQRWGTIQKVFSSQSRLEKIVADILLDMETKDRLKSGRGNALLVCSSIYQACKLYELFAQTGLKGRCAIVTSYRPVVSEIKGEETGEGLTERLRQYEIYRQMLADWFCEAPEKAANRIEEFEKEVKKKFVQEPGQVKLLIVVDKLLTGFDAPPATYLYIDKQMQDHGLFQAICRVNRLHGDDKEYGYIVDYKDLFQSLEGAVRDYTSGAFDAFDPEDVAGLLTDRLESARRRLDTAREAVAALCEPVAPPKDQAAYLRFFSSQEPGNAEQLRETEPRRLALYKLTAALLRAYADVANEMEEAGYSPEQAEELVRAVAFYENLRSEVKLHSGDAIDLKRYEPAMRHLIDNYLGAGESEVLSALEDLSLVQAIVERGVGAVEALPEGLRKRQEAVAETIENNVRRLIIDETPVNPKYFEKISQLLDALIAQRRQEVLDYQEYLKLIVDLTRKAKQGPAAEEYPRVLDTPAKRALYDNLGRDAALALRVDEAVRANRQDDWRNNVFKVKRVRGAVAEALGGDDELTERTLEIIKQQDAY